MPRPPWRPTRGRPPVWPWPAAVPSGCVLSVTCRSPRRCGAAGRWWRRNPVPSPSVNADTDLARLGDRLVGTGCGATSNFSLFPPRSACRGHRAPGRAPMCVTWRDGWAWRCWKSGLPICSAVCRREREERRRRLRRGQGAAGVPHLRRGRFAAVGPRHGAPRLGGVAGQRNADLDGAAPAAVRLHRQPDAPPRSGQPAPLHRQGRTRFPSSPQAAAAFTRFFGLPVPGALMDVTALTPGDFAVVARKAEIFGDLGDAGALVTILRAECRAKPNAPLAACRTGVCD